MPLDVRRLADRLRTCPYVTDLHAGPLGTIVTPTAAGPVIGIRVGSAMLMLGVVVGDGADDDHIAAGVRDRLAGLTAGLPISLSFRRAAA